MDNCIWIAVPGRMARTDCSGEFIYLSKSNGLEENNILAPYVGTTCPKCGRKIDISKYSYDLIKNEEDE